LKKIYTFRKTAENQALP